MVLADDQKIWENLSYTNKLGNIKIPTLLLWRQFDMVIPPKMGQDAYDNLGSASKKWVIFEKSGHSPMDNQPVRFVAEVVDFIERHK